MHALAAELRGDGGFGFKRKRNPCVIALPPYAPHTAAPLNHATLPASCLAKADRVQRRVSTIDLDFKANLRAHVLGEVAICDRIRHVLVFDGARNQVARVARGLNPAPHGR